MHMCVLYSIFVENDIMHYHSQVYVHFMHYGKLWVERHFFLEWEDF